MIKRIRIIEPAPKPSLDLCARLVIMASYLYYRHDIAMMDDAVFDKHCRRLSRNFDKLSDERQFLLGDAESIDATGYHVYVTVLAQSACLAYAREHDLRLNAQRGIITKWKLSRKPVPLRYATLLAE